MALQNKRPIIAEERRHRVLQLKMAGFSDRQIAKEVKVSYVQVRNDWKKRLGELAKEDIHAATVIRTLAMLRYEALFLRWWPLAVNPQITPALAQTATEQVLKILKAEREINGLDPEEPIVVNVDGRQQTINLLGGPLAEAKRMMLELLTEGYALNDGRENGATALPDGDPGSDGLRE